jgi:pimeloyl-ACP methyl ester carboxylesterase
MGTSVSKASMESFASKSARINSITLHYWVGGDPKGTPVVLWHGFLGTAYSWHKVMPLLASAGFSVLVPDMRGYGDSDNPPAKMAMTLALWPRNVDRSYARLASAMAVHCFWRPMIWVHPRPCFGLRIILMRLRASFTWNAQ